MNRSLRAAVIGASGIGRHHAKWYKALGCKVVAFVGSTPESVYNTGELLRDTLGIEAEGYDSLQDMLDEMELDIVSICSPPWRHCEHLLAAVKAGVHVMCEKPLVWDPNETSEEKLLGSAHEMVQAVEDAGVIAAVNTQYAAVAEPYWQLCKQVHAPVDPHTFRRFYMRMDSRGGVGGTTGKKIWIDLAPHPISVLQALAGPGEVLWQTVWAKVTEHSTEAEFIYRTERGREIAASIETCNVSEGSLVRRLGVNDSLVDYEGRNDEQGVYCAWLKLGDTEQKAPDFMQTSISRFVATVQGETTPLATLRDGYANLEMQLRLVENCSS